MKNRFFRTIAILFALILCVSLAACNGESAYQIARRHGFDGTEQEWLDSLKGGNGVDGRDGRDGDNAPAITVEDLYKAAQERGYKNDFTNFIKDYFRLEMNEGSTEHAANIALMSVVNVSTEKARGAGVIYRLRSDNGSAYVVTNYHVVSDPQTGGVCNNIQLMLYGRTSEADAVKANYVGGSSTYDIAVLCVKASEILKDPSVKAVTVADSNFVKVGTTAIAIGNPAGYGIAVTSGIVSVDSEYITVENAEDSIRCMRVDTAINHGNSGGGLFDSEGRLIGLVNAKIEGGGIDNIGYAIPSNIVKGVAENIIWNSETRNKRFVSKGLMGITVQATNSHAIYDEERQMAEIVEDVVVKDVTRDSLAYGKDGNGMLPEDIVVAIEKDGVKTMITRMFMVVDYMLAVRPGDQIRVYVKRPPSGLEVGDPVDLVFDFTVEEKYFKDMR